MRPWGWWFRRNVCLRLLPHLNLNDLELDEADLPLAVFEELQSYKNYHWGVYVAYVVWLSKTYTDEYGAWYHRAVQTRFPDRIPSCGFLLWRYLVLCLV